MPAQSSNEQLIDKDGGIDPALTYASLRAKAIELVQKYSGDIWTDFNLHDPGVTILEYLCFALSDLAYRTHFNIADILTGKSGTINRLENFFFTKQEIFSTNPFSPDDYRKLVLDKYIQVHNVWIEHDALKKNIPAIKGFYKVILQLAEKEKYKNDVKRDEGRVVKSGIKKLLLGSRNIGEDFRKPVFLKALEFHIDAEIEIDRNRLPEEILAEIYAVLNKFISPGLFFYTENELKQQKFSTEEIYNGPSLKNGFLKQEDLDKKRRSQIDPADLANEIAGINGVLVVRYLSIISDNEKKGTDNNLYLTDEQYPHLIFDPEDPGIKIIIQDEHVKVKSSLLSSMYEKKASLRKRRSPKSEKPAARKNLQIEKIEYEEELRAGEFRNIEHYFSIQHLFPHIYKLYEDQYTQNNEDILANNQAMAKAYQLKAYLMIFEQLVAGYLSQLANIAALFSGAAGNNKIKSYFSQPLFNVPGSQRIIKAITSSPNDDLLSEWEFFKNNPGQDYQLSKNEYISFLSNGLETSEDATERKIRALDQVLARFNFSLQKFPVESFTGSYFPEAIHFKDKAMLQWKAAFLNNIPEITMNRNQGFNYYQDPGAGNFLKIEDIKLGGFEKKMNHLLFIVEPKNFDTGSEVFNAENPSFEISTKRRLLSRHFSNNTIRLVENAETGNNATGESSGLAFKKLPLSFLKSGLNYSNYRISLNKRKKPATFFVEYNYQISGDGKSAFEIAGEYSESEKAAADLTRFISQLRYVNIMSEGFHVVEHILLHYKHSYKKFGFNLLDPQGDVIARQTEWLTYDERELLLEKINKMAAEFSKKMETELTQLRRNYTDSDNAHKDARNAYREFRSNYNKEEIIYNNNTVTYSKIINLYIEFKSRYESGGAEKQEAGEKYDSILKNYKEIIENYEKAVKLHRKSEEDYAVNVAAFKQKKLKIIRDTSNGLTGYCQVANEHGKDATKTNFIVPYLLGYHYNNLYKQENDPAAINFFKAFFFLQAGSEGHGFIDIVFEKIIQLFQLVFTRFQNRNSSGERRGLQALQSIIKLTNEKEVPEDFFNLRMTIVLPAWTARFQNKIFRSFAEKLFIDNSPVHMRLHFKWLGIQEMSAFEDLYDKWLRSINSDTHELRDIADKIVSLFYTGMQ